MRYKNLVTDLGIHIQQILLLFVREENLNLVHEFMWQYITSVDKRSQK